MLMPIIAQFLFLTVTIRFCAKERLEFATSSDDWPLFGWVPRAARIQSFIEIVFDVDCFKLMVDVWH